MTESELKPDAKTFNIEDFVRAAAFLSEASRYFAKQMTESTEDITHWAMRQNSANASEAADMLHAAADQARELERYIAESVKWNACCAALRAACKNYIKQKYTTATAGDAERELLERSQIFYKEAGQNLLDRLEQTERELADLKAKAIAREELRRVVDQCFSEIAGGCFNLNDGNPDDCANHVCWRYQHINKTTDAVINTGAVMVKK